MVMRDLPDAMVHLEAVSVGRLNLTTVSCMVSSQKPLAPSALCLPLFNLTNFTLSNDYILLLFT